MAQTLNRVGACPRRYPSGYISDSVDDLLRNLVSDPTSCHARQALTGPVVDPAVTLQLPDPWTDLPNLDTAYSKYGNTNYAAAGQDIHAIHDIIQQRRAQLAHVTAQLATVESIMKRVRTVHHRLVDKRDQIVASTQAHQGLVSCIRRLPPEILGEIFVRCLPPDAYIEPDTATVPLVLLSVCRGWRRVALGTPRLWCSLTVRPSHRVLQQGLFFYHHWLSRARSCPLSLAVDTRRPPRNPVWRYEVMELLQPYTTRSARLHVMFDEATAPNSLLEDVPMLEHLTLEGDLRTVQKTVIAQPEPKLRSLTLRSAAFGAEVLSAFQPGWTHLTQLQVTLQGLTMGGLGLSPETDRPLVLALLALCPNLEEFVFSPVFMSRNDVPAAVAQGAQAQPHARSARTLTHCHLRTLDVIVLHGVGRLLDALTLPDLRHLRIQDLDLVPSGWRQNELMAFLARSRCPLETMRMHGAQVSMRKKERAEYVALVPTLKQVDVCLAVMMHG